MTDMKINALAPWFGSKRTLASRIVDELGPHRAFWDVFSGSMSVMLAKPPATMETVNDLHGDLVNLARVIQHDRYGPWLFRRLRRAWLSKELFLESAEVIRGGAAPAPPIDPDRAFHYFVVSWFGRNGVAGTSNYNAGFCVRYTKNGGHAAKRFTSAVESIPAWRRRMRNVTILSEDGLKLLERIEDAAGVVIYIDPPYYVKGAKYVHDFTTDDHPALAARLNRFKKTRVVVSYYEHPVVRKLYASWTVIECPTTKAMVNQGMRDKGGPTKAPEILLINGPSLTQEASGDDDGVVAAPSGALFAGGAA